MNTVKHEIYWVMLAETLGPRSHALRPLLAHFKGPEEIFAADEAALKEALPDIGAGTLSSILHQRHQEAAKQMVYWCHGNGIGILTYDSDRYPACLRELEQPPAVLYYRGKLPAFEKRLTLGMVGARKCDAYGQQVAYKLSFELSAANTIVVSGLAEGVDGMAAAGALNAGGTPVAVIGCGIDLTYPKEHTRLAAEVADRGVILSEFALSTPPNAWNFPMRNRLISALSNGVVVVQGGATSGSLITARYALAQGKPLFAVPGNITSPLSVGVNRLLAAGAHPALDTEDLLSYFNFLYRDAIRVSALPEAMQYSMLTPQALRPFGLRMIEEEKKPAEQEQSRAEKPHRLKRRKKAEESPEKSTEAASIAPNTAALTPRQRELFSMLPDGSFSLDALTARGVPVSEAASSLTMFEIYGLTRSIPGGMFEKN